MPRVFNKRRDGSVKGAIYVGRGSPWGNPFVIGKDGDRATVIQKFGVYARDRLRREPSWLDPLRGRDLLCFCKPADCHGDVLMRLCEETASDAATMAPGAGAR